MTLSARILISGHSVSIFFCWLTKTQPRGDFSTWALEPLWERVPKRGCLSLAAIVTCTMHGLRHVPGSNHVNVSLLGMFNILSVISKYYLQSSNGTSTPITLSVCKDNHFFAYNTTLTYFSIYVPSFSLRIPSRNPVSFISCGFHPATLSRLFHADFIP